MTIPIWKTPPYKVTDPSVAFAAQASSWGVPKAQFDKIWQTTTGKGIIIASLDSGCANHSLLRKPGKIIERRTFVGGDVFDDNGHGTMTATNAAGSHENGDYIGVAPDAQLIIYKVFTSAGSGPALDKEIRAAVDAGADIITYSGGGSSPYLPSRDAIAYAESKKVMVLASSGNAGPNSFNWPAYFSNCTSVGATKESGGLASFSTTNEQVDIAAPGEQVTVGNRAGGYSRVNGTSFACPHVAGTTALIYEAMLKLGKPRFQNVDEYQTFLINNSTSDLDPHPNWKYGMINMLQVLVNIGDNKVLW